MRSRLVLALAVVAVVSTLGGGALAATRYLLTSTHQIKPSVLKQLRGARGSRGPQGLPGTPGTQGSLGTPGTPGASATSLWAAVSSAGQLVMSSGATSITSSYPSALPALYEITFNRDVSQCAREATVGGLAPNYVSPGGSAPGEVSVVGAGSGNPDAIDVYTYGPTGGTQFRGFMVAVFC